MNETSENEMECGCCHDIFPMSQVELNESGNQFLCRKCRESKPIYYLTLSDGEAITVNKLAMIPEPKPMEINGD